MKPLLAACLLAFAACSSTAAEPPPLRVLFIGNSYTAVNNLPVILEGLARAAGGRQIETGRHLFGGATLERHVKQTGALKKIQEQKWDVVVLQEQSLRPVIDRERMWQYARLLDAEIKAQGARTLFYLTWARQHIPAMQAGSADTDYAKAMYQFSGTDESTSLEDWSRQNQPGLSGGLNGAYLGIAEELGAEVAPVGIAWQQALKSDADRILHHPDKSHPNRSGTYLAACVFYATLLDQSPVGLPGRIENGGKPLADLPAEEARLLQAIAWDVVNRSKP